MDAERGRADTEERWGKDLAQGMGEPSWNFDKLLVYVCGEHC